MRRYLLPIVCLVVVTSGVYGFVYLMAKTRETGGALPPPPAPVSSLWTVVGLPDKKPASVIARVRDSHLQIRWLRHAMVPHSRGLIMRHFFGDEVARPWFVQYSLPKKSVKWDGKIRTSEWIRLGKSSSIDQTLEVHYLTGGGVHIIVAEYPSLGGGMPTMDISDKQKDLLRDLGISAEQVPTKFGRINVIILGNHRSPNEIVYSGDTRFDYGNKVGLKVTCEGAHSRREALKWVASVTDSLSCIGTPCPGN